LVQEGGEAMNLDWKKCDVWALGITLWLMIFQDYPGWSRTEDHHNNNVIARITDVHNFEFDMICRRGKLQRWLEYNEIEFLPMHDLLQNILLADPQLRSSTEDILNHPWLAQS
jgi:serine/threonine protein kinase